jgi:hypothetical protein
MEVEDSFPTETYSKSQTRKTSQKTTRKSKGTKQTRKIKQVRIERTAEYYVERAKYIFNISLGYCINCGTIPKMTQGRIDKLIIK